MRGFFTYCEWRVMSATRANHIGEDKVKNRYRFTFKDGLVIDIEHTNLERAEKKAQKFYNRTDTPDMMITHVQMGREMMTFEQADAWEAEMRKKRADIAAGKY